MPTREDEQRINDSLNDWVTPKFGEFVPANNVEHPAHYADHYPLEVIEIIRLVLAYVVEDMSWFEGYCLGNELKYRLRAGFRGDAGEDIKKAMMYHKFRVGGE